MFPATVGRNRMSDRSLDEFLGGDDDTDEGTDDDAGNDAGVEADAAADAVAVEPETTADDARTGVDPDSGVDPDPDPGPDPDSRPDAPDEAGRSATTGGDATDGPGVATLADAVDGDGHYSRPSDGSTSGDASRAEGADRDGSEDGGDSVPVAPESVAPATPITRWAPEGDACADCGRSVTRLWREREDGRGVCTDCKDW
jgi:hypothetical protein